MSGNQREFHIGLFECGDSSSCIYAWCCSPCAVAHARSNLDGSPCPFNVLCLPMVPTKWMIRTAYDIPGSLAGDCGTSLCCIPCSANQLYQTTRSYGNPTTDHGREFNIFPYKSVMNNSILNCLYVSFCFPCAVGTTMQNGVGMPFLIGCGCMCPCAMQNVLRYQHKLRGTDYYQDCIGITAIYGAVGVSVLFWPILFCTIPLLIGVLLRNLQEANARRSVTKRYLGDSDSDLNSSPTEVFVQVDPSHVQYVRSSEEGSAAVYINPSYIETNPQRSSQSSSHLANGESAMPVATEASNPMAAGESAVPVLMARATVISPNDNALN